MVRLEQDGIDLSSGIGASSRVSESRILVAILSHLKPASSVIVLNEWARQQGADEVLLVHGGSREDFEKTDWGQKVYCGDSRLRCQDLQRERQSYQGVFQLISEWLSRPENADFAHVLFAEYDLFPLVADVPRRFRAYLREREADLTGYRLRRIDRTNSPLYLDHARDPEFHRYFSQISRREDARCVLQLLGPCAFWRTPAFHEVSRTEPPVRIYLELFAPSIAHHLGFRVVGLPQEQNHFVSPLELPGSVLRRVNANGNDAWCIHPVKDYAQANRRFLAAVNTSDE